MTSRVMGQKNSWGRDELSKPSASKCAGGLHRTRSRSGSRVRHRSRSFSNAGGRVHRRSASGVTLCLRCPRCIAAAGPKKSGLRKSGST